MANCIEIKSLFKSFENTEALSDININIEKGILFGLIGPDGAGKTTLLRLICGLLSPKAGQIMVLGLDPIINSKELRKKIAYMPQKFGLYEDLSVGENLELFSKIKNVPVDYDKHLGPYGLSSFKDRLAGALSGGMKQKLGLACALISEPELLILDEPSIGVDPLSRKELFKSIRALIPKSSVIWATSYTDEAMSFDSCILLDSGKVVFSGPPLGLGKNVREFEDKVIDLTFVKNKASEVVVYEPCQSEKEAEFPVYADNLVKKYGNFYAVKNNTFKIKKGEIFGLLGPNGAGKSTSFKMLCGLIKPTSGHAYILGQDTVKNYCEARSLLGYMPQKFSLYSTMSARENLAFIGGLYGIEDLNQSIERVSDTFDLKNKLNVETASLDPGAKQRLSFACALIHRPPVLFLDEATSGVDLATRREFWAIIKELSKKGVTVLITTHFMDEAPKCDRVSFFLNGETIAQGPPEELRQKVGAKDWEETFIKLVENNGVQNANPK